MKKYSLLFIALLSCNASHKPKYKPDKEVLEIVANQLYDIEAYRQAKLSYDTLITIDSNNAVYFYRRGYCQVRLGDYDPAKFDFIRSITLNYYDKISSIMNVGEIYRVQGKFDSAIYYYDQPLKIDPNFSNAKEAKKAAILKDSRLQPN